MFKKSKIFFDFYQPLVKKYTLHFFGLFLMPIFWCLAETFAPYIIKIVIDDLSQISNQNDSYVINILVRATTIYIILMLIMEVSLRLCNVIWIQTIPILKADIKEKGITIFQSQNYSFFNSHLLGDLVTKFRSLSHSFEQIFSQVLYGIYPTIITAIIVFCFILSINTFFAVFFFFWYCGMNFITYYFAEKSIDLAGSQARVENKLTGHVGDLFRNTIATKTFWSHGLDKIITEKLQKEDVLISKKLEWLNFRTDSLRSLSSLIMLALMMAFLAIGWQKKWVTLGDFSFITAACFYIRRSAWMSSVQLLFIFKELGIIEESLKDLSTSKIQLNNNLQSKKTGHIVINNLCFGYDNAHSLLKSVNLEILPGDKIGIFGASGSGKTSFLYLLLRFCSPQVGSIKIDGADLDKLSKQNLNFYIAYVPQQTSLFHRTIYDNIKYGNIAATREDILHVSKLANCHEFIERLEDGYNTFVGENGVKLSGGQRQRISIARALLSKAPILIFDEAFSSLDTNNENKILNNILKEEKKSTFILISHR